jgi:hypothetical protein
MMGMMDWFDEQRELRKIKAAKERESTIRELRLKAETAKQESVSIKEELALRRITEEEQALLKELRKQRLREKLKPLTRITYALKNDNSPKGIFAMQEQEPQAFAGLERLGGKTK